MAIRFVVDRKTLPLNLHGLMGPGLAAGLYLSRDLLASWRAGRIDPIRPIVFTDHGVPDWAVAGEVQASGVLFRAADAAAQVVAVQHGVGVTRLPCFVGDADPLLARVPGVDPKPSGKLWILTHRETRKTKRVRLFIDFVSGRLAAYAPMLAGLHPGIAPAGRHAGPM